MFEIVKKLMMARQLSMEEGRLILLNQNILMMPVAGLVGIQKELEKEGKENLIYIASKRTGVWWAEQMRKYFSAKKMDLEKWGINVISLAGYGIPRVIDIDHENKRMIQELGNSTVAEEYGNVGRCVDHMFRGYIAGVARLFFEGSDVDCVEILCKSKGDKICQFVIKPKKDFDQSNPLVKKQLESI